MFTNRPSRCENFPVPVNQISLIRTVLRGWFVNTINTFVRFIVYLIQFIINIIRNLYQFKLSFIPMSSSSSNEISSRWHHARKQSIRITNSRVCRVLFDQFYPLDYVISFTWSNKFPLQSQSVNFVHYVKNSQGKFVGTIVSHLATFRLRGLRAAVDFNFWWSISGYVHVI